MVRRGVLSLLVFLAACGDGTSPAAVPAAARTSSNATVTGAAGTLLTSSPTFQVTDASGNALTGVPVAITVIDGGGTIAQAPARTAGSATSVGQWTLGPKAGRNALQVAITGVTPLVIEAIGVPGQAAILTAVSGNNQRAPAGTLLAQPLVLELTDQFGNTIANAPVTIDGTTAGSAISPTTLTTGPDGRTAPATWRLSVASQTNVAKATTTAGLAPSVALRAEYLSDYAIDVRFKTTPSSEFRQVFQSAAERIGGVITADIADVPLQGFDASRCGGPAITLNEQADDVIIYADISEIDGVGKILGRAGPCLVRSGSRLTIVGSMQFDIADAQTLLTTGRFEAVVLHEMLHVIGIGSLWRSRSLVDADGSTDPRFIGAQGTRRCLALGFASPCGIGSVPIENSGGSGTAGVHWRESVFDAELMTGFAESSAAMPFSALSIGSLEDLGYTVNYAAADPFAPPLAARFGFPPVTHGTPFDEVLRPIAEVTRTGIRKL